jgi:hypothetical protein
MSVRKINLTICNISSDLKKYSSKNVYDWENNMDNFSWIIDQSRVSSVEMISIQGYNLYVLI